MKNLILLFALLLIPELAASATRYATPTDIHAMLKQTQPGDTLLLRKGVYPQLVNPLVSGSPAAHTTLACENLRQCTIAGSSYGILLNQNRSYIRFTGFRFDRSSAAISNTGACFHTNSAATITHLIIKDSECFAKGSVKGSFFVGVKTTQSTFRRNHFHDHGSHGIYMAGSNNIMEQNRMERLVPGASGNTAYCAQIYLGSGTPSGNIFRDNHCDTGGGQVRTGSNGLYIGSGPNNQAYRNTIINAVKAFVVRQSGTKIWNNTVDKVTTAFDLNPGAGCEIKNNILLGKSTGTHANCAIANNLTAGKPEEFFVNPAKGDYRLRRTALAAIDKAVPVGGLSVKHIGALNVEDAVVPDPIPDPPKPDPVPVPVEPIVIDIKGPKDQPVKVLRDGIELK